MRALEVVLAALGCVLVYQAVMAGNAAARRWVLGPLARSLRPLAPTMEELRPCMKELRYNGSSVADRLRIRNVFRAMVQFKREPPRPA